MRDASYIRYLETLALSAMTDRGEDELIPNIDDPGVTFNVLNARQCIERHRFARAGKWDEQGVIPDPPHTLALVGGTGVFDAYLDIPQEEAVRRYKEEHGDDVSFEVQTFSFHERFQAYAAWSSEPTSRGKQ